MLLHKDFEAAFDIMQALQQMLEVEQKDKNGTVIVFAVSFDGYSSLGFRSTKDHRFVWVYEPKNAIYPVLLFGTTQHLLNANSGSYAPNVDRCASLQAKTIENAVQYIMSYLFNEEVPDVYFPEE